MRNRTQEKETVFVAELERFGYMLTAIGHTAIQAERAVLDSYYEYYKNVNGIAPDEDWADDDGRTYWSVARDEIYVHEEEFGKVWWN